VLLHLLVFLLNSQFVVVYLLYQVLVLRSLKASLVGVGSVHRGNGNEVGARWLSNWGHWGLLWRSDVSLRSDLRSGYLRSSWATCCWRAICGNVTAKRTCIFGSFVWYQGRSLLSHLRLDTPSCCVLLRPISHWYAFGILIRLLHFVTSSWLDDLHLVFAFILVRVFRGI
jgi:hypothetical protein